MFKRLTPTSLALATAILVACGGRAGTGTPSMGALALPAVDPDLTLMAVLPAKTIGENLPTVLGTVHVRGMKGEAGGFTQSRYSQTLAFPPGTKIEIRNVSHTLAHTLDVVMLVTKLHDFPADPRLSTQAHGKGIFGVGYASGIIDPGKSVTVTLAKAGTYIIGCAFHYKYGMRDIIRVSDSANPGPQATAPPPPSTSSPSPKPTSSGGW